MAGNESKTLRTIEQAFWNGSLVRLVVRCGRSYQFDELIVVARSRWDGDFKRLDVCTAGEIDD